MPTRILPSLPGLSMTGVSDYLTGKRVALTSTTCALVEDQIDRTTQIDIDKVHSLAYLPRDHLGGRYHPVGISTRELNTKHLFALVSADQRPFVHVPRDQGLGEGHL